jgi:hypothetical protein
MLPLVALGGAAAGSSQPRWWTGVSRWCRRCPALSTTMLLQVFLDFGAVAACLLIAGRKRAFWALDSLTRYPAPFAVSSRNSYGKLPRVVFDVQLRPRRG